MRKRINLGDSEVAQFEEKKGENREFSVTSLDQEPACWQLVEWTGHFQLTHFTDEVGLTALSHILIAK